VTGRQPPGAGVHARRAAVHTASPAVAALERGLPDRAAD
jgi:hypothetical protein